jgi:hypothetical protein
VGNRSGVVIFIESQRLQATLRSGKGQAAFAEAFSFLAEARLGPPADLKWLAFYRRLFISFSQD